MKGVRPILRQLLPRGLRERYHDYALRRDFGIDRRRGQRRLPSIDPALSPGVNVVGYFDSPSGVGQSARSLVGAARLAGIPVASLEAARPGPPAPAAAPHGVNLYHVNADAAAAVVEGFGPALHAGRANAAYWYWETEAFPPRWRDRFDYFDEIWVASDFCRRAIEAASPIPVFRVPPAVTPPPSPPDARAAARFPASDFTFLTVLDATSVPTRKNTEGAVRAFARAFAAGEAARLVVQISNASPGQLEELGAAARGARVEIRKGPIPRGELDLLFAACDAYVSLHRAEGFGLPIAEAMAAGRPVVATPYSGPADYLDETTGFPVRWRPIELPRSIRDYDAGTRWAEPDEDHAALLLRRVFEDRAEASRRAERGRRRILESYSVEAAGRRISERLEDLRRRFRKSA